MKKSAMTTSLFLVIIFLGIVLRLQALTPFKVYPDSYQSLIVAHNIQEYHSVVGYLGPQGMVYPDLFSWTRPGYPLLILAVNWLTSDLAQAAQQVSFYAGILTLPLIYLLVRRFFHSVAYGLSAVFLLSISFHHAVWGGFIMTETIGVFVLTLFLLMLFSGNKQKERYLLQSILLALLFAFAVLIRYEYSILLFPLLIFFFYHERFALYKSVIFLLSFVLFILLTIFLLFPLESLVSVITIQSRDFLPIIGLGLIVFLLFVSLKPHIVRMNMLLLGTLAIIAVSSFFTNNLIAVRGFIFHDFLLIICFFIGSALLSKKNSSVLFFILLSIILLAFTYYIVNPTMDRYLTHLIPFFILPASYGLKVIFLKQTIKKDDIILRSILILFILIQIALSFAGFRLLRDSSWYQQSYEQQAAYAVEKYILEEDALLLVAQPEPYFYISGMSTQSISNTYPYLFVENSEKHQPIYIIHDQGMNWYFPQFATFIEMNLSNELHANIHVSEALHIRDQTVTGTSEIKVYKTTIESLKRKIFQSKKQ